MHDPKPLIPVIVGPTASGKTALAAELNRHLPLTVISADSRQIYRGLDIGTAKPDREILKRVPHLGIDLVDPGEQYSAGRFARDASGWLRRVEAERQAAVVGGTGFYVRALVDGLFKEPPMDVDRRDRIRQWSRTADRLGFWAARLDPAYGGGGRQRAGRTVEVALLTGRPLSFWQKRARLESRVRPWYVRLTLPRPVLHARIERRTREMLKAGLIDEVEGVLLSGTAPDAPGLDGVGYREVVAMLQGRLPKADLEDTIVANTRRYAKRQVTWFRHQLVGYPVITLDATDSPATLAGRIAQLWEERGVV